MFTISLFIFLVVISTIGIIWMITWLVKTMRDNAREDSGEVDKTVPVEVTRKFAHKLLDKVFSYEVEMTSYYNEEYEYLRMRLDCPYIKGNQLIFEFYDDGDVFITRVENKSEIEVLNYVNEEIYNQLLVWWEAK